jgi:hypothetical protein
MPRGSERTDSKAAGLRGPDGFAFVPHTVRWIYLPDTALWVVEPAEVPKTPRPDKKSLLLVTPKIGRQADSKTRPRLQSFLQCRAVENEQVDREFRRKFPGRRRECAERTDLALRPFWVDPDHETGDRVGIKRRP